MSVRPIYLYGSAVLRERAKPVKTPDERIVKLAYDMFETMHAANGIGLAATQVGELHRVITIDITGAEDDADPEHDAGERLHRTSPGLPRTLTLINPELVHEDGKWPMEEGCLSIPDVRSDVTRAERITVRFKDSAFKDVELEADGLLARVILHEMDHLDGVLFIDRISKTQRGLLSTKLRRIRRGEVETRYPVISDRDD